MKTTKEQREHWRTWARGGPDPVADLIDDVESLSAEVSPLKLLLERAATHYRSQVELLGPYGIDVSSYTEWLRDYETLKTHPPASPSSTPTGGTE